MDLNYRILIIDDEDEIIKSYSEELIGYMTGMGFKLAIDSVKSDYEYNHKKIDLNSYSLFMVDLKFGTSDLGLDFIKKIRNECRVSDILFYSSDGDAIKSIIKKGEFEGVFFAQRDETVDEILPKAKKLLDKTIKISESIEEIRGLVLQNMSLCDQLIKEKLNLFCSYFNGDWHSFKKGVLTYIDKSITHKYRYFLNKINYPTKIFLADRDSLQFNQCEIDLCELYNNYRITNSSINFHIFCKFLKYYNIDYSSTKELYDYLSKIRNSLAHQVVNLSDKQIVLKDDTDSEIVLNEKTCVEIRKKILELLGIINDIKLEKEIININ